MATTDLRDEDGEALGRWRSLVGGIAAGKVVGGARYVHVSAVPDEALAYFRAAVMAVGAPAEGFNVLKLAPEARRLSLLSYPDFFERPFPLLAKAASRELLAALAGRCPADHGFSVNPSESVPGGGCPIGRPMRPALRGDFTRYATLPSGSTLTRPLATADLVHWGSSTRRSSAPCRRRRALMRGADRRQDASPRRGVAWTDAVALRAGCRVRRLL